MEHLRASLVLTAVAPPKPPLWRRLWEGAADRFRDRKLEWYSALAMVSVGLWLLREPSTFDLAPYTTIRSMLSETAWGWLLTCIGVARLLVLGVNGALERGSPYLRALAAGICAVLYIVLVTGYWLSGLPSVVIPLLACLVPFEFATIVQAATRAQDDATTRSRQDDGRD